MTSNNRWYPLTVAAIAGAALLVSLLLRSITVITWFVAFVATHYTIQLVRSAMTSQSAGSNLRPLEREKSQSKKIEVIIVCIAAIGGLYALDIYRDTNLITMRMALEARDSASRAMYYGEDGKAGGERMMSVFFNDPGAENIDYQACNASTQHHIRRWAKDAVAGVTLPEHAQEIPEWNIVRDLYNSLFDASTRTSTGMNDVRRAFFHVIDYVYIVHDAHDALRKNIFNDDEYEMWASYVEDLGPSPFFLMTTLDGQEYGYMTKPFAREIWRRFNVNERLNCFAQTLYPELAQDEATWMSSWGILRKTGVQYSPATSPSTRQGAGRVKS